MRIDVVSVNHGTSAYADLMLRSLITHHPDRSMITITLLDTESDDLDRLAWAEAYGVRVEPSGYPRRVPITSHGDLLRDFVLAHPEPDAYLFVDADVCFLTDQTIHTMAGELAADAALFAVQARWLLSDGTVLDEGDGSSDAISWIRQSVRPDGATDWSAPQEYATGYGDRVHPFCVLIRNDQVFRTTVELLGLSPAGTQAVRGARWFDTLGLLTQVMRTHRRSWRRSEVGVVHFGSVSWSTEWVVGKAADRDRLLDRYRLDALS